MNDLDWLRNYNILQGKIATFYNAFSKKNPFGGPTPKPSLGGARKPVFTPLAAIVGG